MILKIYLKVYFVKKYTEALCLEIMILEYELKQKW